jgi:hypothetical protein
MPMQRSVFLMIIAALALLGVGAYTVLTYAPSGSTGGTVATSTIAESTDAYDIDVQYPQFGIPAIDTQIKKAYDDAVAELKAQPTVMHGESAAKNSFTGRFDDVYLGSDIVSVELILSSYTGGAHPSTIFSGVAYDRATGKRLELADALKLIGKSVAQVSAESTASLQRQLGDSFMFKEGADTNPENYSSFLVTKGAVTFVFQQYQVAPYSFGPQRVSFPRAL